MTTTKTLVSAFAAAALILPTATFASVSITDVLVNGSDQHQTVKGGSNVEITVEVERAGSGCSNNWGATRISIGGNEKTFTYGLLDHTQGAGTETETHEVKAPSANDNDDEHDVLVEVFRGNEINPNNCDTSIIEDTASTTLTVAKKIKHSNNDNDGSEGSVSGGSSFCHIFLSGGWSYNPDGFCINADTNKGMRIGDYMNAQSGFGGIQVHNLHVELMEKLHELLALLSA